MESIYYMNPALGYPYGSSLPRTASGLSTYYAPRTNPMEEAYRYALRILEDSYRRELDLLYHLCTPYGDMNAYCRREHDIQSRYYAERHRLESDFTRSSQQYYYGYSRLRDWPWDGLACDPATMIGQNIMYNYTYKFLNSKETTPVPTETKKWIIISSEGPNDNPKTHTTLADAEKEAQRLARKFPAQEFTIYETKKAYKIAEKPVDVKHFI